MVLLLCTCIQGFINVLLNSSSGSDLHELRSYLKPRNWQRDDFNFPIVNFPFICGNIPEAPAYGVYISQMIRYSRACGSYQLLGHELTYFDEHE
jgi:hypothetical protein